MSVATRVGFWATAAALGIATTLVPPARIASPTAHSTTDPRPAAERGAATNLPGSPAGVTAQGLLISIAQHAQPTASDQQTGTSSCLHLIRWDRYPGRPVIETESIRHVNPDGSGVLYQQTNAPQPTAATTTRFAAGELHSPIDEPIPTDPVRLNDAVTTATPPGSGSTAVVAVLLDLTSIRTLNLAERVAVIRVLAMLPGVELIAWVPGRGTGVGLQLRFSDGRGDPIDVITDQDTGEILGYRLEGPAALQSSTTTLILRRNRCDCPPPSRVMFVSAVRRSGFPPSAGCGIPSGVPTFRPAGAYEGARA